MQIGQNYRFKLSELSLCLLLSLGMALSQPGKLRASDTNAILQGWFAAQDRLQTWTADFTQTRSLKTLTKPLVAQGRLSFGMPNRFRWELGQPARTVALRDGQDMIVVYPLLKRAERYPMGERAPAEWRDMLSLLDAGFPRNRAAFDRQFRLLSLLESQGAWHLTLQPTSSTARKFIREIRLGLSTNDFMLTLNELVFVDGSSMRTEFSNGRLNPPLQEDVFRWIPDPSYRVTDPFGK